MSHVSKHDEEPSKEAPFAKSPEALWVWDKDPPVEALVSNLGAILKGGYKPGKTKVVIVPEGATFTKQQWEVSHSPAVSKSGVAEVTLNSIVGISETP
jgi:hypothetical protein